MMQAAILALSLVLQTSPAQETPSFAGTWERDPERSDDAEAKMHAAFEQMREEMSRRRGGFGGRRGGMGPPPGGGPGRRSGEPGGPQSLGRIADELVLELKEGELHVDDGERLRIYYLDGEEHKRQMPNGVELETVAERKGNAVYIEEKHERGEIQHKYELSPEGETLIVTTTMELRPMKDPVVIRTVYERIAPLS